MKLSSEVPCCRLNGCLRKKTRRMKGECMEDEKNISITSAYNLHYDILDHFKRDVIKELLTECYLILQEFER